MREELPEVGERLLTSRQVANLYGINEKDIFSFIKKERIPKPLENWKGKGNRWLSSEVIAHMRSLRVASDTARSIAG